MATIFISHSHGDWRLAARIHDLLRSISGNQITVARSSEKGAIKSGENWRDWIDDKVLECDVGIVLLTPASFRGRWVLWEAGAVAGVQYQRLRNSNIKSNDPVARRVRVVQFNLDHCDLGPFANLQINRGLDSEDMVQFFSQLLNEFRDEIGDNATRGFLDLRKNVEAFVAEAAKDLRYTPIDATEGLVNEWLYRLEQARDQKDDQWIISSKRWINVAFLGAERAGAHEQGEAIDFRIHMRIADAHRRLKDWNGMIEQLQLAAKLSPNDLVLLRELGRAYRELGDLKSLANTLDQMKALDAAVFRKDREAITLICGYFVKLNDLERINEAFSAADSDLVARDPYLAFWRAYAVMRTRGADKSVPLFQQLGKLLDSSGVGFWDDANRVNACFALGEMDRAEKLLGQLKKYAEFHANIESAARFYDDILEAFNRQYDWRGELNI